MRFRSGSNAGPSLVTLSTSLSPLFRRSRRGAVDSKLKTEENMEKHFTPVVGALRAILPLCLLCTCLSLRAQPVTGHASGGGQLDPNDSTRSSYTPLPVGPAGGGGTAINPNDYGMCGVQSLAGI